jgi:hypothetical protein
VARSPRAGGRDTSVVAGLVVLGIALLFLLPVVGGPSIATIAAAWGAIALLTAAALWLPVRRWLAWPAEDRRASVRAVPPTIALAVVVAALLVVASVVIVLLLEAPGAGLVSEVWRVFDDGSAVLALVVAAAALTYALQPVTRLGVEAWARRKGLAPEVAVGIGPELRRTRTWRTVPAVLGASLGVAPGIAYNLGIAVHGTPPTPGVEALLAVASAGWPYDPMTLALVGYLVGVVIAEATRRWPSSDAGPAARLDARVPAHYLTRPARWIPTVLAGVTVFALGLAWLAGTDEAVWPGVLAVLVAVAAAAVQRWVVRRPQRLTAEPALAVDDELRSSAAHAVTGGTGALLLVTAGGAVQLAMRSLGVENTRTGGIIGTVVAIVLIAGVWALWLGYGSAHPGVRTRAGEPVA